MESPMRDRLFLWVLFSASVASCAWATPEDLVASNVRVRLLSESLVRIEERGSRGFEDRATFTIVNRDRDWAGAPYRVEKSGGDTILIADSYRVVIPGEGASLRGVRVSSTNGAVLYEFDKALPRTSFLPAPGNMPRAWAMADSPRIIPPEWGATAPPPSYRNDPFSGWDVGNDAPDIYVFISGAGGYNRLREEFLKLTGPIPMPPLYAFGFWDSRYHAYSERTALETIDTYRRRRIPLDVFVVDTDWRIGASHGYAVDRKLFPDMPRFIRAAHERKVRLMFNDHPEPVGATALDPKELSYRQEGLTSLLRIGADIWWYDRNWHTHLKEPVPGLRKELWGMRLYHDMTQRFLPGRRPLLMSNVQGIDNGRRNYPPDPAAHRYPIWWTGDTHAYWEFLRLGVANGVDSGVLALLPYVSEDLGGHGGMPTSELYVRFLQFGAFSPVMRVHCTKEQTRYPWAFGAEAERIVTDFIRLRYRLLPTIYTAARRAYDDGTPLLRRCDLEWPAFKEAADNTQYLFGDDLLVAPITASMFENLAPVPAQFLRTADGKAGLRGEYFANTKLTGRPTLTRQDANVDFDWQHQAPDKGMPDDNFSVRWSGQLGPQTESGDYTFGITSDDGARLWVNGQIVIDHWNDQIATLNTGTVRLEAGKTYPLRLEYFDSGNHAMCRLAWLRPSESPGVSKRSVWIPPGVWRNAWSGRAYQGPATVQLRFPLRQIPLFVRDGGIVFTIPQMQHTGEKPWSTIIVDAFVPSAVNSTTRELYEDDGISLAYQSGACARTPVTLERRSEEVRLRLGNSVGRFDGQPRERSWVLRLHWPKGSQPGRIELDGTEVPARVILPSKTDAAIPFGGTGSAPGSESGPVIDVTVPRISSTLSADVVVR
jgi:hypothetical protein